MKVRKFEIIECPKCGTQYLPAEIFYPKSLLGTPYAIFKGNDGRLIDYEGSSMELSETYICDKCGKNLKVTAKCHFIVEELKENVFEEEYVSQLDYSMIED